MLRILDTNVVSELMRPEPNADVLAWSKQQPVGELAITAITMMEVRYGIARLPDGARKNDLEREIRMVQERKRREVQQRKQLKLVSKREPLSHNSWMHNVPHFVRGRHDTNYVYMHPDDAAQAGLADGDMATVSNPLASLTLPVAVTEDMMPGAVALPHGWGHQHTSGLTVASATRGANVNLLSATGPASLEPLSGMAQLNGIVVSVGPAA